MKKAVFLLTTALLATNFAGNPTPAAAFDIRQGFADMVENLEPAVINVFTTQEIRRPNNYFNNDFGDIFQYFFGIPQEQWQRRQPPTEKRQSLGSGFIISADGYALTNNHVVENATAITVKLLNDREYTAKLIGTDKETDVALLKIETDEKLPFVKLGDSDKLRIGDWVVAIGNPLGLGHTVTAGIVSAKERIIGAGPYDQFIQTDASINPGNSGGPLFNLEGEVVGINTAIIAQAQGLGFAIPINIANNMVDQLKNNGKVSRGWLGVSSQDLTEELAESFGLKDIQGALVSQVFANSPAAKAGIKSGDIITAVDTKKVKNSKDLINFIGILAPGTKVNLELIRSGKKMTFQLQLADRAKGLNQVNGPENTSEEEASGDNPIGLEVGTISENLRQRLHLPEELKGVVINAINQDSPLTGVLRKGDVILSINRHNISNLKDYTIATANLKKGQKLLLHVWRDGGALYLAVKIN